MEDLFSALVPILMLVVCVLIVAGIWKVFVKAGKPGWACLVPIYNVVVLLDIAGKPVWWVVLMLIPVVSLVVAVLVSIEVAKKFGQSTGYGVGLALLPMVFYPMLGFGDAKYQGAAAAATAA